MTFKQLDNKPHYPQPREETDPDLESKYEELWSHNQERKSKEMSILASDIEEPSLRDITSQIIVNNRQNSLKQNSRLGMERAARKEENRNSRVTHRRGLGHLMEKIDQPLNQTIPYPPPLIHPPLTTHLPPPFLVPPPPSPPPSHHFRSQQLQIQDDL